jgi:Fe-S-cluster containining protein
MQPINLRSFRQKARKNKRRLRAFLTRLGKKNPRKLDDLAIRVDKEVWHETDCMSCANCCKTMSPTYSREDIVRISSYLDMPEKEFKKKWLFKDDKGDWLNKSQPCQFLDLKTNMCGIYEVRPGDCAGFPHFTKKKMVHYMHVHKQNLELCPATYRMVEKMKHLLELYEDL